MVGARRRCSTHEPVRSMTASMSQAAADVRPLAIVSRCRIVISPAAFVGEELAHRLIEGRQSGLVERDTDERGDDALRDREDVRRPVELGPVEVPLEHDLRSVRDHERLRVRKRGLACDPIGEGLQRPGVESAHSHARLVWRADGKSEPRP